MTCVTELTEIVCGNNDDLELLIDQEAVTEFRTPKEEFLEDAASDLQSGFLRKRCVGAVSETANSLRDVHAQNVGIKVVERV